MTRPTWRKALSDVYVCSAGRRALALAEQHDAELAALLRASLVTP